MKFLDYDIKNGTHRSAEEEWALHKAIGDSFFEWHYFTAPMMGANGHQYFFFLCNFNFSGSNYKNQLTQGHPEQMPEEVIPYLNMAYLADYDTDLSLQDVCFSVNPKDSYFNVEKNALLINDRKHGWDIELAYKGDEVYIHAKCNIYECEIKCTGASRVMWMQDKLRKEGFIQEGAEEDRSFYYSLPKLPFSGWIKYKDNDGKEIKTEVVGQGWVDRQWGDYSTKSWEWTSFRFADGDRVNTYNFGNGYQVCTYQKADGATESFPSFTVIQNGYLRTPRNTWVSWGWDYVLPVKDKKYHLVPMSDKDILNHELNTFFEGLSRIYDMEGNQVGWAVTESMDVRVMHNAPYDKFNHFPE